MDVKFRVVKTANRKRQPQKSKRTPPIRRSARLQERLAQEEKAQDTQIQPPTVAKPSGQKHKQPNKPSQLAQPAEKPQRPSSETEESSQDTETVDSYDAIDYWRTHLDWPEWYLGAEATMPPKVGEKRPRPKTKKPTENSTVTPSVDYVCQTYEEHLGQLNIFLEEHEDGLPIEVR